MMMNDTFGKPAHAVPLASARPQDRHGRCGVTAGSSNKKAGFCAGAVRVFHLVVLFVLIKGRVVLVVVPR